MWRISGPMQMRNASKASETPDAIEFHAEDATSIVLLSEQYESKSVGYLIQSSACISQEQKKN